MLQQQRFQDLRATAHQLAELRGWDPCDAASRRGAHAGGALVTIQTGDLAQHRPRLEVAQDYQLSLGPLVDDLQHTLFDQDHVFARIALLPQPRPGLDLGLLPQLRKQGS